MNDDVTLWLGRLKSGDAEAQQRLWEKYYAMVVRLARRRLSDAPCRDADEEDVAQSAFNSFFRAAKDDRFPKLDDRDDLWRLLVTITSRKVIARRRRMLTQKRGAGKVRGESVFGVGQDDTDQRGLDQVFGSEPTPEAAADISEAVGRMLDQLEDESLKLIAHYRLEGYTNDEIAEKMGCVTRTVERKLERIRRVWTRNAESSGGQQKG